MTNQIAAVLAVLLLCAVGADIWFNNNDALLFLSRKLMEFIEWLAFWR